MSVETMGTYRIVESKELVMKSCGSLGCHAHDVSSATCPLEGAMWSTRQNNGEKKNGRLALYSSYRECMDHL